MSYKYKPLPHACSLPAPGAFWPRWFYQVPHPGCARIRNTLHCLPAGLGFWKHREFRRDRNAKHAIITRRPIHGYAKWYSFYLNESITTVLLHVIPHNCSEMHRNVAMPDYPPLVTQTSGMDICQIGYDICEFDSLRGLGIVIIGRLHFDNRDIYLLYGWPVLERRPNHVNKRVVADIWLLTVSWTLTWEMIRIRNFYCFVYRQHIWLRKWEVIVGGHDWSCWDLWI